MTSLRQLEIIASYIKRSYFHESLFQFDIFKLNNPLVRSLVGMQSLLFLLLIGSVLLLVHSPEAWKFANEKNVHPVILIPGFGGSRIEATLKGKHSMDSHCAKNSGKFTLWLGSFSLIEISTMEKKKYGTCFVENMKLEYKKETRTTSSMAGVNIITPDLGNPSPVEVLYPDTEVFRLWGRYGPLLNQAEVFRVVSDSLEEIGLTRNVNIKGAPYDFRKAPNENQDYFHKLKVLVEKTYKENGKMPVVLVAHSMGGPMILYFLRQQPQEWKDKYIKSLVSLSAVWGGSLKSMKGYIEGDDLGYPWLFSSTTLRKVLTTLPSLAWMMPHRQFWGKEVLVSTSKRNYTLDDMKDFFYDLQLPNSWEMYKDVYNYTMDFGPPGVEVHCLYGMKSNSTLTQLHYNGGLGRHPHHTRGYGDDTVDVRSLEGCLRWKGLQKNEVYHKTFLHLDHFGILKNEEVKNYIKSVVQGEK